MKKLIYFFGLILSIGFVACNQDDDMPGSTQEIHEVKASFFTKIQTASSGENFGDLKSTGLYDRNNAPVYVDGVIITAVNGTLNGYGTKTETFSFEPVGSTDGDNPIEMTLGVGHNDITAEGIPTYSEGVWTDQYFTTKDGSATLAERAAVYSPLLTTTYPIYVEYATDSVAKQIVGFNTNWYDALLVDDPRDNSDDDDGLTLQEMQEYEVNGGLYYWTAGYFEVWPGFVELDLTPQTGRTNIVFEAEKDFFYRFTPTLYAADGTSIQSLTLDHNGNTDASAIIFNSSAMVDGTYIEVLVEKSDDGSDGSYTPVTDAANITVTTQIGKNVTHVVNFDGEDQVGTDVSVATYNPITTDSSQGQTIDES